MQLSKLRSGMRKLAGVSIPRQDRTSGAFKKASAVAGHAPDAGVADGSSSARARTDRPSRAKGGRVCREDGGSVGKKREPSALEGAKDVAKGAATGLIGTMLHDLGKPGFGPGSRGSLLGRAAGRLLQGAGALGAVGGVAEGTQATLRTIDKMKKKPADSGSEEDRKSGGAVKKGR